MKTLFSLRRPRIMRNPVLCHMLNTYFQTSLCTCAIRTAYALLTHLGITWMHISTYIFCCKQYGLKHIYPCSGHFESCRGRISHMAYANHICADKSVCMRSQNRVGTIGLPPGNQTTNCAYFDRLPFAQTYLCICCLRISSCIFCPDEDTRCEHKMHVQL